MPSIITKGAISAQGFGWSATSMGGPYYMASVEISDVSGASNASNVFLGKLSNGKIALVGVGGFLGCYSSQIYLTQIDKKFNATNPAKIISFSNPVAIGQNLNVNMDLSDKIYVTYSGNQMAFNQTPAVTYHSHLEDFIESDYSVSIDTTYNFSFTSGFKSISCGCCTTTVGFAAASNLTTGALIAAYQYSDAGMPVGNTSTGSDPAGNAFNVSLTDPSGKIRINRNSLFGSPIGSSISTISELLYGNTQPSATSYNQCRRLFYDAPRSRLIMIGTISDGGLPAGLVASLTLSGGTNWIVSWNREAYTSSKTIYFNNCCVDNSGNLYVVGGSLESNAGIPNVGYIAKYDMSGNLIWQRQVVLPISAGPTGPIRFNLYSCVIDSYGDLWVSGYFQKNITYFTYGFVMKVPTDGSKMGTYNVVFSFGTLAISYTNTSSFTDKLPVGVSTSVGSGTFSVAGTSYTTRGSATSTETLTFNSVNMP